MENAEKDNIKLRTALKIIDMITAGASIENAMNKYFVSYRSVNYIMKHKDNYQNCLKCYLGLTIDDTISIRSLKRNLPIDHYLLNWMRETFEAGDDVTFMKFISEAVDFWNILSYRAPFADTKKWTIDFEKRHNVNVITINNDYDSKSRLEAVKKSLNYVEFYGPMQFFLSFLSCTKLLDCKFTTEPDDIQDYSDATKYDIIRRRCAFMYKSSKFPLSFTENQEVMFRSALSQLLTQANNINQKDFFKKLLMNDDWAPFGKMMCSKDLVWMNDSIVICPACYDNVFMKERHGPLFFDSRHHRLTFDRTASSRFCNNCYKFTRQYRQAAECSDCYIQFWKYKLFYKFYRHVDIEIDDATNY